MKVAQNGPTITYMILIPPPQPSNIPNIEPPHSGLSVRWIVRYCYSTRMNLLWTLVQNSSTNPDTSRISLSDVHDTYGMIFPPPDTLFGNHPEPVLHLRMISPSVHQALYNVRVTFTIHLYCHAFDCYDCFIFIVSPPSLCSVVPTTDVDAPVIDYVVDNCTPLLSSF